MARSNAERSLPWAEEEMRSRVDERQNPDCEMFGSLSPSLALISAHTQESVLRILGDAFGAAAIASLELIPKGASGAGIFKVIVDGTAYLMRIEASPDGLRDVARHYACLRIAVDAGVSPRLHYANVKHATTVTDFIQSASLHSKGSRQDSLEAVVAMLKKLHGAPLFPESIDYLDSVSVLMHRCQVTGILPKRMSKRIQGLFAKIALVYPRTDLDLVSSHNDMHPGNLLLEGERAWLVDWEAAYAADRFVDLAATAISFWRVKANEIGSFETTFGESFTETHRARLFLMRQVNRLFYVFTALEFVAVARPDVRLTEGDIYEMKFDLTKGMDTVSGSEDRLRLACALLKDVSLDLESFRFVESLLTLSGIS